jgi:hypothetical protein
MTCDVLTAVKISSISVMAEHSVEDDHRFNFKDTDILATTTGYIDRKV